MTIASSDGMTRMNSDITKYGLIGRSFERSLAPSAPSHGLRASAIAACAPFRARLAVQPVAAPPRASCASTSLASPRIGRRGVVRLVEVARIVGRVDDRLARAG